MPRVKTVKANSAEQKEEEVTVQEEAKSEVDTPEENVEVTEENQPEEQDEDNTEKDTSEEKSDGAGVEIDTVEQVNDNLPKDAKKAVSVDVKAVEVDEAKKPKENVKIRLRKDHSCCIAMEFYDFKEGKVYTVPKNVKRILNRAGLLAPL